MKKKYIVFITAFVLFAAISFFFFSKSGSIEPDSKSLENKEPAQVPVQEQVQVIALKVQKSGDAILIPSESVIAAGENDFAVPVLIIGDNAVEGFGTIKMQPVSIEYHSFEEVTVNEGINEGDFIVIDATGKLSNAQRVKIESLIADEEPLP